MRHVLRTASLAAVFLTLAQVVHGGEPERTSSSSPLFVRASVSTAGPYGESWYVTLAPDGDVFLQVFYSSNPSGSLLARFSMSEDQVGAVRKACETHDFFGLASELAPARRPLHQPDLRLEVHLGGRHHKVSLYDPAALKGQATTARFLGVWKAVFEALPLRPSW